MYLVDGVDGSMTEGLGGVGTPKTKNKKQKKKTRRARIARQPIGKLPGELVNCDLLFPTLAWRLDTFPYIFARFDGQALTESESGF